MFKRIKELMGEAFKSRLFVMIVAFVLLFSILIHRCFTLQIVNGKEYLDNYKLQIQKKRTIQGTRGNIYDRNGKVLAENKLAYSVMIEDNGSYASSEEKNKSINKVLTEVIEIVEANGDSVINDFGIVLDANGAYQFVSGDGTTSRKRFLADVYGLTTVDKLTKKQQASTPDDIIRFLCEDPNTGFGIDTKKVEDKALVLKLINIRYAMRLKSFQKYIPITVAFDVSEETVANIMEHLDVLPGISIAEESLRNYPDSKYFANMLGYTGQISQSEYDAFQKEGKKTYQLTDIIGKAGLEQTMDSVLQGKKGEEIVYVNNVGKVLETEKKAEAKAGNNLYLSIDKDLQIAVYNIIEEKLAGLVLSRMQNVMNFEKTSGTDDVKIIPADDVYHSFFGNDILDLKHLASPDAKPYEKSIYETFAAGKDTAIGAIMGELRSETPAAYRDLSKEMQAYMSYIATDILTNDAQVLMSDVIDKDDATYKAWKEDDSISLKQYLNYAITKNWVDTSKLSAYLPEKSNYADSNELYEGMLAFIESYLKGSTGFDKLVYKYLIKSEAITGRVICLALYEQGILAYDEAQFQALEAGTVGAYDFIRGKIETLEITPGQLGLEPCTGSAVVTDVNTGAVLACVSYPGYDNNRLANTMDSEYFSKLNTGLSKPLYNNATQETTAPGSTFKMVSSVAGLTEGTISADTVFGCSGPYGKITPSPKCWIYPSAHGSLNIVGAIQNSCNNFFYELAYRMGTVSSGGESVYSSKQGLAVLEKYAKMFGLDKSTGLEIPESQSHISDEDAIRSAIGQGTHNYTVSQLARYTATVANSGTLYDLTLLDHVEDVSGDVVEEFQPKVADELTDVSDYTWNLMHQGMRNMVSASSTFKEMRSYDFEMSGKTGTAQQSKSHANHALFVGYAPSAQPEIALATRIAYGDKSAYAAEIGRDIVKYYYNLADPASIILHKAATIGTVTSGD